MVKFRMSGHAGSIHKMIYYASIPSSRTSTTYILFRAQKSCRSRRITGRPRLSFCASITNISFLKRLPTRNISFLKRLSTRNISFLERLSTRNIVLLKVFSSSKTIYLNARYSSPMRKIGYPNKQGCKPPSNTTHPSPICRSLIRKKYPILLRLTTRTNLSSGP